MSASSVAQPYVAAGELVADGAPGLARRRDPLYGVGGGVGGFDLATGKVAAQPPAALGVCVRVRDYLDDLIEAYPRAGQQAVADGMPHLPHDLQVVDLVGQHVHRDRNRPFDGVLDGDDGAVDDTGGDSLDGVLVRSERDELAATGI